MSSRIDRSARSPQATMITLWILMAVLVILGAFAALRRRRSYGSADAEPWRSSLEPDEPLDIEEARRAEDEWLQSNGWEEPPEDESWR